MRLVDVFCQDVACSFNQDKKCFALELAVTVNSNGETSMFCPGEEERDARVEVPCSLARKFTCPANSKG